MKITPYAKKRVYSFINFFERIIARRRGSYAERCAVYYALCGKNKAAGNRTRRYLLQTSLSMGKRKETYENIAIKVSRNYLPDKDLKVTYKLFGYATICYLGGCLSNEKYRSSPSGKNVTIFAPL